MDNNINNEEWMKVNIRKHIDGSIDLRQWNLDELKEHHKGVIKEILNIELDTDEFDKLILAYHNWILDETLSTLWEIKKDVSNIIK